MKDKHEKLNHVSKQCKEIQDAWYLVNEIKQMTNIDFKIMSNTYMSQIIYYSRNDKRQ